MIEPALQPWQPVHLALERAQLLLGSKETEGVDLPPDNVFNPRHFANLLPGGRHGVSSRLIPSQASITGPKTGQATKCPQDGLLVGEGAQPPPGRTYPLALEASGDEGAGDAGV